MEAVLMACTNSYPRLEALWNVLDQMQHMLVHDASRKVISAERTEHDEVVAWMARYYGWELIWHEPPASIARHHNFVRQHVMKDDQVLFIEEDTVFLKLLDVRDDVKYLQENPDVTCIRYIDGTMKAKGKRDGYDVVINEHMWSYTNRLHLRNRKTFERLVPLYKPEASTREQELGTCKTLAARRATILAHPDRPFTTVSCKEHSARVGERKTAPDPGPSAELKRFIQCVLMSQ